MDLPQGWMTNLLKGGEGGEGGGDNRVEEEGEDLEAKEVMIHPPGKMQHPFQPTAVVAAAQDPKL